MLTLVKDASALRTARCDAKVLCRQNDVEADRTEAVALVVSELLGNALRHGRVPVTCAVTVDGEDILVVVNDAEPLPPVQADARPTGAEGGRGLFLVAAVSRRWGWSRTAGGKRVWARV